MGKKVSKKVSKGITYRDVLRERSAMIEMLLADNLAEHLEECAYYVHDDLLACNCGAEIDAVGVVEDLTRLWRETRQALKGSGK